jgi:MFS family permease
MTTGRRRLPLHGWLTSEAIALTGTRVSMIAIPWFVLTTTGSATKTGLVAFAEMAPYVVAKAAAGPWIDRLGPRRVCIGADLVSVLVVGAIPALHALGLLTFPALLAIVAAAGAVRGPSDAARHALVPQVVAAAGVPLERATGLGGAVERLASTLGAALGGVLVAALGATAVAVNAACFGVAAAVLALALPPDVRRPATRSGRGAYRAELRDGWRFLRGDSVLLAIVMMISVTNLLDAAYASVLVPVWAEQSGGGALAMGALFATFSGAAVLGSVVAAAWAHRLPRRTTYLVAFLLGGLPRFAVLALDSPLVAVLVVAVVGGFACGFVNPILGAVIFERIPAHLVGRVTALTSALSWAGIPFGAMLGGLLVTGIGWSPAFLVAGGLYLLATLLPMANPAWRELDDRPTPATGARAGETAPART